MKISEETLSELVLGRKRAQDLARGFSEAIKAQAEKHKLKPAALRAYVTALADDKLIELGQLADQLAELVDDGQPDLFSDDRTTVTLTNPETGEVIFHSNVHHDRV